MIKHTVEKLSRATQEQNLADISGEEFENVALWVRCDVEEPSADGLDIARDAFHHHEVIRHFGVYTLSFLFPQEIRDAAQQAVKELGADGHVSRSEAIEELNDRIPPSLHEPQKLPVTGLGQFGDGEVENYRIGVLVDYPGFTRTRNLLTQGMDRILGIQYDWRDVEPHVNIARGQLDNVSNQREVTTWLPSDLHLSPALKLKD